MRLRNQILALSLVTLLLPLAGWKLVREMENFMREAEEQTLMVAARTIARALPAEHRVELGLARGTVLPLRKLPGDPVIDGYTTDWPQTGQALVFESPQGDHLALRVLAGRSGKRMFLALKVIDSGDTRATAYNGSTTDATRQAGIMLYVQGRRGQHSYMISSEAPGPLAVESRSGSGTRLVAAWMDDADGYTVELGLPADVERISVGAVAPVSTLAGASAERHAGTTNGRRQGRWLELAGRDDGSATWLAGAVPANSRAWLVQSDGWVVADSGPLQDVDDGELTWAGRMLYQAVADSSMHLRREQPLWPLRFEAEPVASALAGNSGALWLRDADSAVVYSQVAIPVMLEDNGAAPAAAVVLETRSDGLLLMTNRALGRFSFIAVALVVGLAASLWLFATRLSRRVRKLSAAVSNAMDNAGHAPDLPSAHSGDEVGELARNTEKLLKAVSDYTQYLQKLAGRLSHELKTPIAITRSSLDNLDSTALDDDARQYLARAREGLERQTAIVAAMSEAQRLEGSVQTADWAVVDLAAMLRHSVAGYRAVHEGRSIVLQAPAEPVELRCAPDLIAQALDKLVDNAISLSAAEDQVTVSLRREERVCLLGVANTGTRLPDVLPEQLFDSLVSMRDKKAGRSHLGLGLYIVRLVAEAHGGAVSARNLPGGQGVEFIIRLPAN